MVRVQVMGAEEERGADLRYLAIVRPERELALSFKWPGVLAQLGSSPAQDWAEGVTVTKGQLLALLEEADFANRVSAARARYDLACQDLARSEPLASEGTLSGKVWDATVATQRTARAELALAEQALGDVQLRAPFDGAILSRLANRGETVAAGQPVLVLGDMRTVRLEVGVPETLVGRIRLGQSVKLTTPAQSGEPLVGVVKEVGAAAAPGTRLFRVVLGLDNTCGRFRPGMTASVYFPPQQRPDGDGVLVPMCALLLKAGGAHRSASVFVAGEDGYAHIRAVDTGEIWGNSIMVRGLSPGERVIVSGLADLADGLPVSVLGEGPRGRGL